MNKLGNNLKGNIRAHYSEDFESCLRDEFYLEFKIWTWHYMHIMYNVLYELEVLERSARRQFIRKDWNDNE